jgi:hypothetical protein
MKKEIWSKGKTKGTVITDTPEGLPNNSGHTGTDAHNYYGGALVAESIWRPKDVALISSAPDMLEALENLENDNKTIPDTIWEMVQKAISKAKNI